MKVNVSAIVAHLDKDLLMQRSLNDDYYPGACGISGGYMEKEDETIENTAKREVFEELGVRIVPTSLAFNYKNEDTDSIYKVLLAKLEKDSDYPDNMSLSAEANGINELELTPYTKDHIEKF